MTEKRDLALQIVRFVDDSFPGWVECQFADALGNVHTLVHKYPYFTEEMLDADSHYPQPGAAECEILSRTQDADRGELVHVRMLEVESTEGISEFTVRPLQLSIPPSSQTKNDGV